MSYLTCHELRYFGNLNVVINLKNTKYITHLNINTCITVLGTKIRFYN